MRRTRTETDEYTETRGKPQGFRHVRIQLRAKLVKHMPSHQFVDVTYQDFDTSQCEICFARRVADFVRAFYKRLVLPGITATARLLPVPPFRVGEGLILV